MEPSAFSLLAIDDDPVQIEMLKLYAAEISFPGVNFFSAESAEAGLELVKKETIDLVLCDYRLPDGNGIETLRAIKSHNPLISVSIMTAFEKVEDAVEVLKNGGDDYLVKPTKKQDIEHLVLRIFEQKSLERENKRLEESLKIPEGEVNIIHRSGKIRQVLNLIARSAESDATVLITGESGTGKELIAQLIHRASLRRNQPFVTVNIAALSESLLESELFGHTKGSFTGAEGDRIGRFEEAHGGTLFIDEVGDIPLHIQVKLLRIIQFGQVQRVGENRNRSTNVRIIAATNRDLERMIDENRFRGDLYWRLNVIQMHLPPLRERKDDIEPLVEHFIRRFAEKNRRMVRGVSREAMDRLMTYSYPGNIRELENIIERAVILCRGELIHLSDLPLPHRDRQDAAGDEESCEDITVINYEMQMQQFERQLLQKALDESEGNQSKAARSLQISERRLRSRMEILNIENSRPR